MATSEAQKKATKEYRKRRGGVKGLQTTIGATVSPAEADRIKTIFKTAGISNAEALKRAAARIEQGDDLTREYDRETDSLKPL